MNKCLKMLLIASTLLLPASVLASKLEECMTDQCVKYFKSFEKASRSGHQSANVILGNFYYYGHGVKSNPRLALTYFKKAAKAKITSAQYMSGLLYVSESDFRDVDDGIEYLEKAAKKEHSSAIFMLGVVYLTDEYGIKDAEKADNYLATAYENRHERMPVIINHIKKSTEITATNFPKLYAEINKAPMLTNSNGSSIWPDAGIERITVNGPTLTNMLNEQLLAMRKPIKSLGTRLQGKSCGERIECKGSSINNLADLTSLVIIPTGFGVVSGR
jgi:tetratricopeptide (TPR) repeat protein